MAKDPSRFIYMDYKAIDLKRLAAAVRKHGVDRQVIFTTDRHDLIRQWRQLIPRLEARGILRGDELPLTRALCRVITGNASLDLDFGQLFRDDVM
jgi:hypothetical protein